MRALIHFWRINFILIIFFIFGGVILGRLIYLQIIHDDFYKAQATGQQEIVESVLGPRGDILFYDKGKLTILATNKNWFLCYANPAQVENIEETANVLEEILQLPKKELLEKLKTPDRLFVVLKKKVTEEEAKELKKQNLKGIYLKQERYRFYPYGNLAADLLGFVDAEGKGKYGVEGYFDEILTGKEAWIKKDLGIFHFSKSEEDLFRGKDIILTIDKNIQLQAQNLLLKAKEELKIEGGQIIVAEPTSGKILALADLPTYDPNNYSQIEDLSVFKNQAIQSLFEPGSMFKPITMAIALNQGKITPKTEYVDEGYVEVGGRTIYNYKKRKWGRRTMTEVLKWSINTGAVFAESLIGDKVFLEYIKKLGFFEATGVELEEEIFSLNPELQKGYKANFATASFGQGIELTPLNFTRGFCALANGGNVLKMHIVSEIRENGKIIEKVQPEIVRKNIFSKETLSQLTEMLIGVVEEGYGKKARIPGYWIAGKTGTSQIPYTALGITKRGYSEKTWQSFIGFFPAFDPKFLILVKLDNPNTSTAEYSAAPIFRELAQYIINYYQIPPDYIEEQ